MERKVSGTRAEGARISAKRRRDSPIFDKRATACVDRLEAAVRSVSISHDNRWVASAPKTSLIDVSDAATGAHATLQTGSAATCVRFHPTLPLLAYSTGSKPASPRDGCLFVQSMSG